MAAITASVSEIDPACPWPPTQIWTWLPLTLILAFPMAAITASFSEIDYIFCPSTDPNNTDPNKTE